MPKVPKVLKVEHRTVKGMAARSLPGSATELRHGDYQHLFLKIGLGVEIFCSQFIACELSEIIPTRSCGFIVTC